jgi:transformation/transcription domain-associated protein
MSCLLFSPLAYSMVADLLHHVRSDLDIGQLTRIVHSYTCNLHDPTLAPSIQTMCSKLLLNLIESVMHKEVDEATKVLYRILDAFVRKVEGIAQVRKDWIRWSRPKSEKREGAEFDDVEFERQKPIAQAHPMIDPQPEPFKDPRYLFRNLIVGIKTIITALKHIQAPLPEPAIMGRLFEGGVMCMSMFDTRRPQNEIKETTDTFSQIFIQCDHLTFQEVLETRMPFFFDELLDNHELLAIPHYILSNDATSQVFVGILFRFLVSRLDTLGSADKEQTSVTLRLFKMAFMAVTIFPEGNEAALQPHVSHIIMQSLKLASQAQEPTSYYVLLRALFRSIGGGRFELLYKEVLPLLQVLLESLHCLLNSADRSKRELFSELILTVPVRLSVLLPFLSYLMKPLVIALSATGSELVTQGLRTLELCIDNLTQEFLNPLMTPVIHEVNASLWKLLKPLPFNHHHAHTTVRILGKIGGRNRKILGPPKLEWKPVGEQANVMVKFDGKAQPLGLAPIVDLALRMIRRGDVHYRRNAYDVFKHCVVALLNEVSGAGVCQEQNVVLIAVSGIANR